MHSQSLRNAFTLIELLVVIAIIAVLAAILFPVFAAVREKGRQIVCASNLKQIGSALMMYQQDHDEAFPPFYDSPAYAGEIAHAWPGILQPYSKNYGIWKCPSDPDGDVQPMYEFGSYFVNTYLNGWCNHPSMNACGRSLCDATPPTLPAITYPVTTVVLGDGGTYVPSGYLTPPSMWCDIWTRRAECYAIAKRHTGGTNYVFVDGHVRWLQPTAFRSDNPDRSWLRVEQTSCWFPYPHNDGQHPWFKP